jgi:hypothetical protein
LNPKAMGAQLSLVLDDQTKIIYCIPQFTHGLVLIHVTALSFLTLPLTLTKAFKVEKS